MKEEDLKKEKFCIDSMKEKPTGRKKNVVLPLLALLAFLAVLAALFVPALTRARRSSWSAVCISNVKQLMNGCKMYACDYDGRFPGNLVQLDPEYITQPQIFFCPADPNNRSPEDPKNLEDANISYVLTPGLGEADDSSIIAICDKSIWNHESGKFVCYLGGNAEFVTADKLIDRDFEKIAKALESYHREKGRYPTPEEGLSALVHSGHLKFLPLDLFAPDNKSPYGYATKSPEEDWILTSCGPDKDRDIDSTLYSQEELSREDLAKLKTKLVFGMFAIKRTNGDVFRIGP